MAKGLKVVGEENYSSSLNVFF